MAIVKGKVVTVDDYYEFKIGNRGKMDYCPITIRSESGELVLISASMKTMMEKTYIVNSQTGGLIQVGMIKPRIGDWLEVEGSLSKSYDMVHSKTMKYIKRIVRTLKQKPPHRIEESLETKIRF